MELNNVGMEKEVDVEDGVSIVSSELHGELEKIRKELLDLKLQFKEHCTPKKEEYKDNKGEIKSNLLSDDAKGKENTATRISNKPSGSIEVVENHSSINPSFQRGEEEPRLENEELQIDEIALQQITGT